MIYNMPETQGCSHPRYIQMQGGLNILHPVRHSEGVTIVNHYQSWLNIANHDLQGFNMFQLFGLKGGFYYWLVVSINPSENIWFRQLGSLFPYIWKS